MTQPTIAELRSLTEAVFGRRPTDAQLEAYRGRLPTMADNVRRLERWAPRLRAAEPALIQRVIEGAVDGN